LKNLHLKGAAKQFTNAEFLRDNKILNSVPIETPIIAVGIKVLGDIIHREKKKIHSVRIQN